MLGQLENGSLYEPLVFFLESQSSAECEVCGSFCRSVLFCLISGFVHFFKNDHYMNRPEKLLSVDNCSHYKIMG